jgi:hypothetical protein
MTIGTVYCGVCGKSIEKVVKLKNPRAITASDIKHNRERKYVFNCCGRTWLMRQLPGGGLESVDCGPEIVEKHEPKIVEKHKPDNQAVKVSDYKESVVEHKQESNTKVSRVFRICDAYESGVGHGQKQDGLSNDYYSDPELNEAYQLGYKKGQELSTVDVSNKTNENSTHVHL